jgi:acyl-CoA thioesterase
VYFDDLVGAKFQPADPDGTATVRLDLRPEHHGVHGFVHGGVLCTLVHQSAGAAAYARCQGQEAVMIGMQINFVKSAWTGALESRSRVVRHGSRTSLVETQVYGDDGELRVTATSTFLVLTKALTDPAVR